MNLNEKPVREKYKEFYGSNTEQMELLIKDNRIPLSIKQIIERRLNSKQNDWKDNYFDTCDACVYGEDGKFKIVKNSEKLLKMTPITELKDGGILVAKSFYEKLKSKEFSQDTPKEKIWKELLNELYEPYIKMLGYCPDVYFNKDDVFCIRAFYIRRLVSWSRVYGRSSLHGDGVRLVGLASEMQTESGDKGA